MSGKLAEADADVGRWALAISQTSRILRIPPFSIFHEQVYVSSSEIRRIFS
jgi:hypothetical protein